VVTAKSHGSSCIFPWQFIVLPLSLVLLSILDAHFTLVCIQRGGDELNPLMILALRQGPGTFVFIKLMLTIFPATVLVFMSRVRLAAYGLYLVNAIYLGVLYHHLINLIPF
jgi:Domain of unknown function (DUF5658)